MEIQCETAVADWHFYPILIFHACSQQWRYLCINSLLENDLLIPVPLELWKQLRSANPNEMTFQSSYIFHGVLLFHKSWTNVKIGFVKKQFNLHSHSVRCDVPLACKGFCCWWGSQRPLRTVLDTSRATVFLQRLLAKCWGVLEGGQDEMNVWKVSFFDLLLTLILSQPGKLLCKQVISMHLQNWYWWQRGHCVRKDYSGPSRTGIAEPYKRSSIPKLVSWPFCTERVLVKTNFLEGVAFLGISNWKSVMSKSVNKLEILEICASFKVNFMSSGVKLVLIGRGRSLRSLLRGYY